LKTWRTAHDFGQREAASQLGISQKAYSRYERRDRFVKGELARRLMTATGVPLEVLAGVAR
jgi:transcriptional regulator with XRE-family HTH domain